MSDRPSRIYYYLGEAISIAARAECAGQHVGAVIVGAGNRVLSTGYNGAPEGWGNCSDGGVCPRCDLRDHYGPGNAYDKCICVHAEMNAIAAAARYGMALDGATAFVTHQPCFTCAKEMVQAGIERVYFAIALPVGESVPAGKSESVRRDDLYLKRTEARLLGQLQAVHVKDTHTILAGLSRAVRQFKTEQSKSAEKCERAQAEIDAAILKDQLSREAPSRNGAKPTSKPRRELRAH